MKPALICLTVLAFAALPALADEQEIQIHEVTEHGIGDVIGSVKLSDGAEGLTLTPSLKKLTPGAHGFHIHQKPSCEPADKAGKMAAAEAAGGHYDPQTTGKHEGPTGHGHMGDLPALLVNDAGVANQPVTAPRLKLADVKGHALMIHANGDTYSDDPKPLGGGGPRVACGVIE